MSPNKYRAFAVRSFAVGLFAVSTCPANPQNAWTSNFDIKNKTAVSVSWSFITEIVERSSLSASSLLLDHDVIIFRNRIFCVFGSISVLFSVPILQKIKKANITTHSGEKPPARIPIKRWTFLEQPEVVLRAWWAKYISRTVSYGRFSKLSKSAKQRYDNWCKVKHSVANFTARLAKWRKVTKSDLKCAKTNENLLHRFGVLVKLQEFFR